MAAGLNCDLVWIHSNVTVLQSTFAYSLNYNWQIWECNVFSLYTTVTSRIDKESARQGIEAILHFMYENGILTESQDHEPAAEVKAVYDTDMVTVRTKTAGLFEHYINVGQSVKKGDLLACILDPYLGIVLEEITAPSDGVVFFLYTESLVYARTAVIKIIS